MIQTPSTARFHVAALLLLCTACPLPAQRTQPASGEARAARALETARKAGAAQLYAYLKPFPKGADLHTHLWGAIYAETIIADAAREGRWVGSADPGTPAGPMPPGTDTHAFCGDALTWMPDGKAWLLYGTGVFDQTTGTQVGDLGVPNVQDAHVVMPDTVELLVNTSNQRSLQQLKLNGATLNAAITPVQQKKP